MREAMRFIGARKFVASALIFSYSYDTNIWEGMNVQEFSNQCFPSFLVTHLLSRFLISLYFRDYERLLRQLLRTSSHIFIRTLYH